MSEQTEQHPASADQLRARIQAFRRGEPVVVQPRMSVLAVVPILLAGCDSAVAREQPGLLIGIVLVFVLAVVGIVQSVKEPAFPPRGKQPQRRSDSAGDGSPDFNEWTSSSPSAGDSCDAGADSSCDSD